MTPLVVHLDETVLDIVDYDIDQLRELVDRGGVLYWDNAGLVGKVSNGILRNVIETYDAWQTLAARKGGVIVPADARRIRWEQVRISRDPSALERARLLRHCLSEPPQSQSTSGG